jgi:hypothetical protein
MKASVIISDVNEQGMRLACIQMLCNQHLSRNEYEVLIFTDSAFTPEDETVLGVCRRQYSNLHVVSMPGKNRAELINQAARRAKGELLLFIESHCIADRNWVKRYVDLFRRRKLQAARGDVRTMPSDSWEGIAEEHMRMIVVRNIGNEVERSYFDFHNSAMTKKCFFGLGGLSERLPILAEFELGARAHLKGIDICRFPECRVWHANNTRLSKYAQVIGEQGREKAWLLKTHGREFVEKYFPAPTLFSFLPWMWLLRIPLLLASRLAMFFAAFGFYVGKMVNSHGVANFYFVIFARNSHRYGMLKGLGE